MTAPSRPEALDPGRVLYDTLVGFLRDDGWPVSVEDDAERAVAVTVEGGSGRWVCVAQFAEDRPVLLFSSVIPAFVPAALRAPVGEYLNRANQGMLSGGFQFDLDEGEVRFVTALDLGDVDPAPLAESGALRGLIRQLVYVNVATVDRYLSGLMAVIHAGADPAAAVAAAEADQGT
ncbi:YbjN domain-containing protein [Acidiferrimicrobium sp. IK]|uniref:YbjN domain-containing protein n=1 Tax=Acidiferrimicrobium sp. IK TaxID=2871700 RepID=UPI0021CB0277|nr:YbjN domain-containing protein [Acidiferrimicrobium sp. IK]MCU4186600.1 YbjN domain-containing protein [Acidiferrimicrobium sp. IK]